MALTDNLISYYKFDEGSGTTAIDSVGSFNGTITGGTYVAGKIGTAISCDPSTFKIPIGATSDFNFGTGDFSIAFWVKFAALGTDVGFFEKWSGSGAAASGFTFNKRATNLIDFVLFNAGARTCESNTTIDSTTNWYHIVAVRSGANCLIYINGVQDVTLNGYGSYSASDATLIATIGNGLDADWKMNGILDEFGIWNRALTATEAAQLYSGGIGNSYPFNGRQNAKHDSNYVPTLIAVLNSDGSTVVPVLANPSGHSLDVSNGTTGSDNGPTDAKHDQNHIPTLLAISSTDWVTPVVVYADASGKLLVQST